jgi:hypothetical protein
MQTIIGDGEDGGKHMVFSFVEDLDDVAIGWGINDLKDIRTSRQGLSAHARNLNWRAESHSCFSVPVVCLRTGYSRYNHQAQAEDHGYYFESVYLFHRNYLGTFLGRSFLPRRNTI